MKSGVRSRLQVGRTQHELISTKHKPLKQLTAAIIDTGFRSRQSGWALEWHEELTLPPLRSCLMAESSVAGELVSHAIEVRDQQQLARYDEVCSIQVRCGQVSQPYSVLPAWMQDNAIAAGQRQQRQSEGDLPALPHEASSGSEQEHQEYMDDSNHGRDDTAQQDEQQQTSAQQAIADPDSEQSREQEGRAASTSGSHWHQPGEGQSTSPEAGTWHAADAKLGSSKEPDMDVLATSSEFVEPGADVFSEGQSGR